jgi:exopolysaccharide biosynthesis polyprenyl glycosylphosphotransferase
VRVSPRDLTLPAPTESSATLSASPVRPLKAASVGGAEADSRRRVRRSKGRVRSLIAADLSALVLSAAGTTLVAGVTSPPVVLAPAWALAALGVAAAVMWIGVLSVYGLYERQSRSIAPGSFDEVAPLFNALLAGSLLLLLVDQGLKRAARISVYTPLDAVLFLAFALVLVPCARFGLRRWVLPRLLGPRRALIVGAGPVGKIVERQINTHPEYGLELVGFVDDEPETSRAPATEPLLLGRTADLARLVDELNVDRVVLTESRAPYEQTLELVRAMRRPDVHLSIVPNYFEVFASNATIEELGGMPVVSLPPMALSRSVRVIKRTFDVAVAATALLVLAPLLVVVAIAIKLDSQGPVLFRQLRNGRGGRPFRIIKFRTMVADAETRRFDLASENELHGPLFKMREDPRLTRVGRFLRRWSIDELPQLWNVVRGEMSLVGPRPFVVHENNQIAGWAARRLETTPGITGLWQMLGRNDVPFEEMVKLDYVYVTNWSLWWDLKILVQTIPVVLARKGAY